jgi:hypothetical protein
MEEYPHEVPEQVINGFVFAVYGVYEYYKETGSPDALWILQAALTTLREYVYDFRVPGGTCYYCLAHRSQYTTYHLWVVGLVTDLYRISGDPFFRTASELFEADRQAVIAAGSIAGPESLPAELSDAQWKLAPRPGGFPDSPSFSTPRRPPRVT